MWYYRFLDHSPHRNSPHSHFAHWTTRPIDNLPHGQLASGTTRPIDNSPHDNSPHGQLTPRTTRPITYDKKFIVYYFIYTFYWFTSHCTVTQIKHLWHARKTEQMVSDKPQLIFKGQFHQIGFTAKGINGIELNVVLLVPGPLASSKLTPRTTRPTDNSPHGQLAPSKLAPQSFRHKLHNAELLKLRTFQANLI